MIGQDRTDADLESLLRATFAAEARQQVPDQRPVPPFPAVERVATVHPIRRRWVGLSVVAASLVAVVVGASVIGSEAMRADQAPTPAGTSVGPEPTASLSATPSDSPTSPPPSATSSPAGVPTRQITVQGVVLTVPTTWTVGEDPARTRGALFPATCVSAPTTPADGCVLAVAVGSDGGGPPDVDVPEATGDSSLCGYLVDGGYTQRTVTADQVDIDGQVAEHRVFTADCVDGAFEQWTVATAPLVRFVTRGPDAAARAQAAAAVRTAVLPGPRSAIRLADRGVIAAVDGDVVRLDRVTRLFEPGTIVPVTRNTNPATYDYPITAATRIEGDSIDGAPPFVIDADDLRALAAGQQVAGIPSLDRMTAVLETDGTTVTRIQFSAGS